MPRSDDIEANPQEGLLEDMQRALPTASPSTREACYTIVSSWLSRKFIMGVCILFPISVTFYVTFWFLTFFDNFFSPLYYQLFHFHVFGLGFVTSMAFILCIGIFFSSWLGTILLGIGEWMIRRLPLVKHIYSASKQVSAALNPESETNKAFQECVLIRHPRIGEYAFGFITGRTSLRVGSSAEDVRLCIVYVPTNHVYVGDIFMLEEKDVIRTNLSVREGLEVVISVGMAVPKTLHAHNA
ncbi:hypothetical protein DUNSADRAFT_8628 [Dunaliella salina]|uniref:Uncharacterized protein n=1 Tax=Dunaliella salina TaxID=3046 RepID=A0ABQ7H5U0_DUNSA|nr:hypothetical protein DUNSADRAFT_8628 [Dunaliella salina]|eukprot:KAF5842228.1 hypothetical protein DUNSADRAFT_8628 [Dunaliella salina]